MSSSSSRSRVRRWYAGMCLVVVLVSGVLSLDRYSSAPDGTKDCLVHVRPAGEGSAAPGVADPYPSWLSQRGGTVNDASCRNPTRVYGVVRPHSADDVARALAFARKRDLSVSVAGTRHSMGGQASYPGALVLDMRGVDAVSVHRGRGTVTVGAGATWQQVLEAVHAEGLSVAAMPSIDVLSVGGTVSVNAHGADFRTGSLASTVRRVRLMTPDGSVIDVDRRSDPELFGAVVGGYGLFGVILEVELETVENAMYDVNERVVPTSSFVRVFEDEIVPDPGNRLMYAHLSTSPGSFLEEAIVYTYRSDPDADVDIPPLRATQNSRVGRLVLNLARHGGVAQRAKWAGQRYALPRFRACVQSRNEALRAGEACLVSRNQAMYNDLGLLRNRLTEYTDILHEYFLPHDELEAFLAEARGVLREHDAELLSASIRSVGQGEVLLDYAPGPRLSVVLYLSQRTTRDGDRDMADLTERLVGLALAHGGTFYLPYQQHYTRDELLRGYPRADEFFALKDARDPGQIFMNGFYGRFAPGVQAAD